MHRSILTAGAALALAACNGDQPAGNAAATEQNVTNEIVITNDTTAIDAATGDAANMAPDVPYAPLETNEAGEDTDAESAPPARTRRRPVPDPEPLPAEPRASDASEDSDNSDTL